MQMWHLKEPSVSPCSGMSPTTCLIMQSCLLRSNTPTGQQAEVRNTRQQQIGHTSICTLLLISSSQRGWEMLPNTLWPVLTCREPRWSQVLPQQRAVGEWYSSCSEGQQGQYIRATQAFEKRQHWAFPTFSTAIWGWAPWRRLWWNALTIRTNAWEESLLQAPPKETCWKLYPPLSPAGLQRWSFFSGKRCALLYKLSYLCSTLLQDWLFAVVPPSPLFLLEKKWARLLLPFFFFFNDRGMKRFQGKGGTVCHWSNQNFSSLTVGDQELLTASQMHWQAKALRQLEVAHLFVSKS